jgi:hypothetical protein
VYVASASLDDWADPEGEFLAALYASPIYKLYGKQGLSSSQQPAVGEADAEGYVGYHLREGKHDINSWDWAHYIKFADKHFFGK